MCLFRPSLTAGKMWILELDGKKKIEDSLGHLKQEKKKKEENKFKALLLCC